MGSARIMGCAVEVTAQKQGFDTLYTVSGAGAERLRALCAKWECEPGDMKDGAFTIPKSNVTILGDSGEFVTVAAIGEGLDKASQVRARG